MLCLSNQGREEEERQLRIRLWKAKKKRPERNDPSYRSGVRAEGEEVCTDSFRRQIQLHLDKLQYYSERCCSEMSVWSINSSSSWRHANKKYRLCTVRKCDSFPPGAAPACSSPWWLVWNIHIILHIVVDVPSHCFVVRTRTYHSITCQVDMVLSCVTRGFSHFERAGDFLFFKDQAESKKGIWQQ